MGMAFKAAGTSNVACVVVVITLVAKDPPLVEKWLATI